MTTTTFTDLITAESQLRDVFGWPSARAVNKQLDHLDQHCRAIIAKSPFLLLGTSDTTGRCDVSPKGDYPGFVRVLDDTTLAIPDLPPKFCAKFQGFKTGQITLSGMPALALRRDETPSVAASRSAPLRR